VASRGSTYGVIHRFIHRLVSNSNLEWQKCCKWGKGVALTTNPKHLFRGVPRKSPYIHFGNALTKYINVKHYFKIIPAIKIIKINVDSTGLLCYNYYNKGWTNKRRKQKCQR
jgi:hypothetical protein